MGGGSLPLEVGGGSCAATSSKWDVEVLSRCGRWELYRHSSKVGGGSSCVATPLRWEVGVLSRGGSPLQMWEVGVVLPLRPGGSCTTTPSRLEVGVLSLTTR